MGKNYRFFLSFVWIVLGLALAVCNMAGLLEDWGSMGFALLIVGILQVLRHIRYRTNEEYRPPRTSGTALSQAKPGPGPAICSSSPAAWAPSYSS